MVSRRTRFEPSGSSLALSRAPLVWPRIFSAFPHYSLYYHSLFYIFVHYSCVFIHFYSLYSHKEKFSGTPRFHTHTCHRQKLGQDRLSRPAPQARCHRHLPPHPLGPWQLSPVLGAAEKTRAALCFMQPTLLSSAPAALSHKHSHIGAGPTQPGATGYSCWRGEGGLEDPIDSSEPRGLGVCTGRVRPGHGTRPQQPG